MKETYGVPGGVEDEGSGLPGLSGTASCLFPRSVTTTMVETDVLGGADLLRHV
jgi:hypothetical protein